MVRPSMTSSGTQRRQPTLHLVKTVNMQHSSHRPRFYASDAELHRLFKSVNGLVFAVSMARYGAEIRCLLLTYKLNVLGRNVFWALH